ncbi:hypothetical protein ACJEEJ_13420 [Enterococcus faecalis]|uniref:hypothetical protein n=1 Tax=Enterococcus faecalis TaxID=1351 RepID=UPI0039852024
MLIPESNYLVKEYNLLKVQIYLLDQKKIINRDIAFPVELNVCDVLGILQRTLQCFTILSFNEEKVLSVLDRTKIENINKCGLNDKHWTDGLQYILELENQSLSVVCNYDLEESKLVDIISTFIRIDKIISTEEISECWILRNVYLIE